MLYTEEARKIDSKTRFTISFIRNRKGLTQTELGRKIGVSQATVSAVECGRTLPSEDMVRRIAAWTGLSFDQVCGKSPIQVVELF